MIILTQIANQIFASVSQENGEKWQNVTLKAPLLIDQSQFREKIKILEPKVLNMPYYIFSRHSPSYHRCPTLSCKLRSKKKNREIAGLTEL